MGAISAGLAFLSFILAWVGLILAATTSQPWVLRVGTPVQAACVALATVGLGLYVGSEDSYRNDGTSRWDAYGAHGITIAAIVIGIVAVGFLIAAWLTVVTNQVVQP